MDPFVFADHAVGIKLAKSLIETNVFRKKTVCSNSIKTFHKCLFFVLFGHKNKKNTEFINSDR